MYNITQIQHVDTVNVTGHCSVHNILPAGESSIADAGGKADPRCETSRNGAPDVVIETLLTPNKTTCSGGKTGPRAIKGSFLSPGVKPKAPRNPGGDRDDPDLL